MRPSVRRDGIVVRDLPEETLVYDRRSHEAHCLNRTAAAVFRAADGTRSVEQIAAGLDAGAAGEDERDRAVRLALDELGRAGLLEAAAGDGPSRREMLRRVGIGAAFLVPVVVSVLVPTAAEALTTCVSDCTNNQGKACSSFGVCDGTNVCQTNSKGSCSDNGGA